VAIDPYGLYPAEKGFNIYRPPVVSCFDAAEELLDRRLLIQIRE
jgi:hypothetical protein